MGYIATVTVLLDTVHIIPNEPNFGRELYDAISKAGTYRNNVPVNTQAHVEVIEVHHCDRIVPVLVGGNMGHAMDVSLGYTVMHKTEEEQEIALAKVLAAKHGYYVAKKPERKSVNE